MLCPISLTPAALEAQDCEAFLPLALIKTHAGVDEDDFDELIDLYRMGAIEAAENSMHRAIVARAHVWVFKRFPICNGGRIELPRGKAQSVESIVYTLADGSTVTLAGPSSGSPAGTDFREDLSAEDFGVVMPRFGECWPVADCNAPAPIVVNFTAGYATTAIPSRIKHALLREVSDAIDIKGVTDQAAAINAASARFDFDNVLAPYRLTRFY